MTKVLAAWFLVASAAASPAVMPRDVVQGAVARVIATLEEAKFNQPGEVLTAVGPNAERVRGEIRRIATDLFDFDEVARRALSRHWAGRTRAEQTEFTSLFTDLLERSYMNRIEAYAGERILYTAEAVDGTYATVRSKVLTQRRSEILLDYKMHLRDSRWQVYDVLIDGVSFVSTYRSQFDRVIQAESYGALVERLRKRNLDTAVVDRKKL